MISEAKQATQEIRNERDRLRAERDALAAQLATLHASHAELQQEEEEIGKVLYRVCKALGVIWEDDTALDVERVMSNIAARDELAAQWAALAELAQAAIESGGAAGDTNALSNALSDPPEAARGLLERLAWADKESEKFHTQFVRWDTLRREFAKQLEVDPETWPEHGNAPLAISAAYALAKLHLTSANEQLATRDASLSAAQAALERARELAMKWETEPHKKDAENYNFDYQCALHDCANDLLAALSAAPTLKSAHRRASAAPAPDDDDILIDDIYLPRQSLSTQNVAVTFQNVGKPAPDPLTAAERRCARCGLLMPDALTALERRVVECVLPLRPYMDDRCAEGESEYELFNMALWKEVDVLLSERGKGSDK